jgi:hypothetical protein
MRAREFNRPQKNLVIFDIDDTLLHTTAKIRVVKDGHVVRELNNQQFNIYKLKPGEQYDFGEFKSAEKFHLESEPIEPMVKKIKSILAHSESSDVIMLTARSDFDDRDLFLKTFTDLGIDMSQVHVHRAGNLPGDEIPAEKKAVFVRRYADTGKYYKIVLYDDSRTNLRVFKDLKDEYPDIDFRAYYVGPTGQTASLKEGADMKKHGANFVEMFEKFLPIAMRYIGLKTLPKMEFEAHIDDDRQPTFGRYVNGEHVLHVALMNRHPNDILRTIAHELTHYKQDNEHQLDSESGRTGSPIENEAHATAGIVMRHFNKQYPEYLNSKPITENIEWYKDLAAAKMGYNNHLAVPRNQLPVLNKLAQSIMDNPPSTMSPRDMARYQQTLDRRKMNLKAVDFFASHPDPEDEMEESMNQIVPADVLRLYDAFTAALDNTGNGIPDMIRAKNLIRQLIQKGYSVGRFGELEKIPDHVELSEEELDDIAENFADGKHPGRKGLSKRMGVNTKASVSSLRRTAKHSTGEKARMAHWLANMKAGRAKAKKK